MENKKRDSKQRNPIVLLLFAIVFPLIITLGLAFIVLSVAGVNVTGWVKDKGANIPVVSTFVSSDEEIELERKLEKARETIEEQNAQLDDLNNEITSLENIVEELELENKKLKNRESDSEDNGTKQEANNEEIKQAAASFRKMDPEKAAPIIQNLDTNRAVEILTNLSGDIRGEILAEMEPKKAAELTEEMSVK